MGKDGLDFPGSRDQEVKRVLLRERHRLLNGDLDRMAVAPVVDVHAGLLIGEDPAKEDLPARYELALGRDREQRVSGAHGSRWRYVASNADARQAFVGIEEQAGSLAMRCGADVLGYGMLCGNPDGVADVASTGNRRRADEGNSARIHDLDLGRVVGDDAVCVG